MPTTHTTPIDLRGFHGRECEVKTKSGRVIKSMILLDFDGDLFVEDASGRFFIQRVERNIYNSEVKSITILDPPSSIDPRWDWKDGEIVYIGGNEHTCHVLKDDLVCFMSNITGVSRRMFRFKVAYDFGYRKLPTRKLTEITEEIFRSTAWGNKKVMYNAVEQGIYGVDYYGKCFTLVQNGTQHYSQCKLIEE